MNELDAPSAERPELCRALPQRNLDQQEVRYVVHPLHAQDLYLANQIIPEGTFGLEGEAVAAVGAYALKEGQQPKTQVFLLRQTGPEAAKRAMEKLRKLRSDWGDELLQEDPQVIFRVGEDNFCSMALKGNLMAAVFFAPDRKAAVDLLDETLRRASE